MGPGTRDRGAFTPELLGKGMVGVADGRAVQCRRGEDEKRGVQEEMCGEEARRKATENCDDEESRRAAARRRG